MPDFLLPSPMQIVNDDLLNYSLYVKREDLIHPIISGNKYRKLKYNLAYFQEQNYKGIISYGGVFSNHLHAVSYLCDVNEIPFVAIIRGEDHEENKTLQDLKKWGTTIYFVTRSSYREKEKSDEIRSIIGTYNNYITIPEGGNNDLALKGVGELIDEIYNNDVFYTHIAVAAGTGCTAAGILKAIKHHKLPTKLLVFSALKGDFLKDEITKIAGSTDFDFFDDYSFGGFAKYKDELLNFINLFEEANGISVDHVYNGKLLYGLYDLSKKNYFKMEDKVLWVHTGGLQGKL